MLCLSEVIFLFYPGLSDQYIDPFVAFERVKNPISRESTVNKKLLMSHQIITVFKWVNLVNEGVDDSETSCNERFDVLY